MCVRVPLCPQAGKHSKALTLEDLIVNKTKSMKREKLTEW